MAYGAQQYNSGRGYSGKKKGGQGFWVGRPEFGGAPSNYDRGTIRPLTVARGDPRATLRVGAALAGAGKEYYNYWNRGGAEGVQERMAKGGEAFARGLISEQDIGHQFDAPDAGTRMPATAGTAEAPGLPQQMDWGKVDDYLGIGVNAAKKVAANPTVQAGAKGAVKGAMKGAWAGPGGMVAGAARGATKAVNESRQVSAEAPNGGGPSTLGSAVPSELDEPPF